MSKVKLEDVLEEYAAATPAGNDLKILQSFAAAHPEFSEELADFAAARAVAKHAPEEKLSAEEEKHLQESGLNNLRMVLSSLNKLSSAESSLQSLTESAKTKGMSRAKFAAALGLSVSLVQYLEKRRLDFASIPKTLIEKISDILETSEEAISVYLNQSPINAANTSFKAQERPGELKPKNFVDAVNEDQTLSTEEKRHLIEM